MTFPGIKRPGRGVEHPPSSSVRVKERVQLQLYSPSGPSWPVLGRTLPLPVLFTLQKSVTSRTCNNEYRMDFRRFLRHLEFSSESRNHCSDVQSPAWNSKADTLKIRFNRQEAVTRKPCLRRAMFIQHVCLVLWRKFAFYRFSSSAGVKERVELPLYSPLWALMARSLEKFTFTFIGLAVHFCAILTKNETAQTFS